ncbi:MAG: Gfo/Idh/MocA family oxidoreductase [Anaerolineae bacterium]|nr:Gfo/Idh/MocA family oxidoreductase [Anaerolineae bacterium]
MLNLVIIGAGAMGQNHAAVIKNNPLCRLVGMADANPQQANVAARFDTRFYTDIETMLLAEKPDGAIIVSPNHLHADHAELCAQHGVHMLIEKPVADSLARAQQIIVATEKYKVRALVGHHRRHSPLIQKTRAMIAEGALGQLVAVMAQFLLKKPDDYFEVGWRSQKNIGGPTLINLIHDIDGLRFMCGEITQVYAQSRSSVRQFDVEDTLSANLVFANGALGTVLASDAVAAPWSYEQTAKENPMYFSSEQNCYHFAGTAGALAFPSMHLWQFLDAAKAGWQHPMTQTQIVVEHADPLARQLTHFCHVIQGTEPPLVTVQDAARSLATVLALLESARSGQIIFV